MAFSCTACKGTNVSEKGTAVLKHPIGGFMFSATMPVERLCADCKACDVASEVLRAFEICVARALITRTRVRSATAYVFCRKSCGISRKTAAKAYGISERTLQKIEAGTASVDVELWGQLLWKVRDAHLALKRHPEVHVEET